MFTEITFADNQMRRHKCDAAIALALHASEDKSILRDVRGTRRQPMFDDSRV